MSIYWLLLGVTALLAYLFGSLDSLVLASNFVFHRNLLRPGDQSRWISNFRRLFGISGFFKLFAVEVVKNAIPIATGALLLGIRGHADVGAPLRASYWCWETSGRRSTAFAAATPSLR